MSSIIVADFDLTGDPDVRKTVPLPSPCIAGEVVAIRVEPPSVLLHYAQSGNIGLMIEGADAIDGRTLASLPVKIPTSPAASIYVVLSSKEPVTRGHVVMSVTQRSDPPSLPRYRLEPVDIR